MAIATRDLMRVKDHPEVKAAIEALDQAAEATREAWRAWKDADRAQDERAAQLEVIATRVLAEQEG